MGEWITSVAGTALPSSLRVTPGRANILAVQPSHGGSGHPRPWYRVLWEELLVAAFEDVHLRIVEAGVDIDGPIAFPDETAPGTNRGMRIRAGHATRGASRTCSLRAHLRGTRRTMGGMSAGTF